MPNVWCVMGACDVVICVVCLWCCDVGTKLFISSSRSLIDILTQFHTGHYQCELGGTTGCPGTWAESWTGDMRHQWHPSECLDWRHETPVTSIWMPGSHQSQSLPPAQTTPGPPSALNVFSIQISGGGGRRVKGLWGESDSGDILQQQKLYYCGVSRSSAEEREWGEFVGNLDRVCGEEKNFADVLIKNLATKLGRKNIF